MGIKLTCDKCGRRPSKYAFNADDDGWYGYTELPDNNCWLVSTAEVNGDYLILCEDCQPSPFEGLY